MILWLTTLALAQSEPVGVPTMNVQYFRPSIDATGTLWVDDTRGGTDGLSSRVLVHYTGRPLSYRYEGGNSVPVVNGVAMADLLFGYGAGPVRFGVDVPVVLSAEGIAASGEFGLGDVAGDLRFNVLQPEPDEVGVGVNLRYALPTASTDNPLGAPNGDWELALIGDYPLPGPFLVATNVGIGGHPGVEVEGVANTQVRARVGLVTELTADRGFALELASRDPLKRPDDGQLADINALEGMLSAYARAPGVTVRGGLGSRLFEDGIGAADLRAVLGVQWTKQPPPPDTDGDGIADPDDLCRTRPEDFDGVLDDDGCPDATPKVMIDLVDAYGQVMNGTIAVYDGERRIGKRDGGQQWELEPGSYRVVATDPDGKEVERELAVDPAAATALFEVPMAMLGAVRLSVVDEVGNPVEGARYFVRKEMVGKGSKFAGQMEAGKNGMMIRAKGFRPARIVVNVVEGGVATKLVRLKPSQVAVDGDRFTLGDRVYFESGSATLAARSTQLLDEVVGVMLDNPNILGLRIEGHTDAQGSSSDNKALSQSRAEAVRDYLVDNGVEAARLEAVGYGEEQLVDRANTEEAHEKNRRVEFVVTKRAR